MKEQIEDFIFEFYKVAINDLIIGYHFKRIKNFNEHIPHIAKFWLYRLTDQKNDQNIKFNFINVHKPLGIKKGEIDRWVILFFDVLDKTNFEKSFKDQWVAEVKILKAALVKVL